jgi:hypothetical protein
VQAKIEQEAASRIGELDTEITVEDHGRGARSDSMNHAAVHSHREVALMRCAQIHYCAWQADR